MSGLLPNRSIGSFAVPENTDEIELLKEYAWDFDNNCLLLDSKGNYVIVEGLEALQVRNYLDLQLFKNRYFIFGDNGGKIKKLKNRSYDYVCLNAQKYIEEAILDGTYVTSIDNLKVTVNEDKAIITFRVNSVYGEYKASEEV